MLRRKFECLTERMEESRFICSVRGGLIRLIPILLIGAISLIITSFPVAAYQQWLQSFLNGLLMQAAKMVYNATYGLLSLYMVYTVGISCYEEFGGEQNQENSAGFAAMVSFAVYSGVLSDAFQLTTFGAKGIFLALFAAMTSVPLYLSLYRRFVRERVYTAGADARFNRAMYALLPLAIVTVVSVLFHTIIIAVFPVQTIQEGFVKLSNAMFARLGPTYWTSALFVLLSSVLWFFGIHGNDVLENVTDQLWDPAMATNQALIAAGQAPTEIFNKEFLDMFVFLGGCGATMCLLLAMALFGRHSNSRSMARLAALPMLFNVNELLVFGLPIVYNPWMLIPFLLVPQVALAIAALAMHLGLVPLATVSVEWTTPVILGGMMTTGSVRGALLQIFILAIGTLIYAPFIRLYDAQRLHQAQRQMKRLAEFVQSKEESGEPVKLLEQGGGLGQTAKMLAMELKGTIDKRQIVWYYQPQFNEKHQCVGAEALLRWNHPIFGCISPPLIVRLAEEGTLLESLTRACFEQVANDFERLSTLCPNILVSINVEARTMEDPKFYPFVQEILQKEPALRDCLCIELTERSALHQSDKLRAQLAELRAMGIKLAIDDFSMGSTSLKYLQSGTFDVVKLDGNLVRGMNKVENIRPILKSIAQMAETIGFELVAEYVETAQQRETLEQMGCLLYQGYLYSPAVPLHELCTMLEKGDVCRNKS